MFRLGLVSALPTREPELLQLQLLLSGCGGKMTGYLPGAHDTGVWLAVGGEAQAAHTHKHLQFDGLLGSGGGFSSDRHWCLGR